MLENYLSWLKKNDIVIEVSYLVLSKLAIYTIMKVTTNFEVTGWDPVPYDESEPAAALSQVTITKIFRGGLEGTSTARGLFCGCSDGSGSYVVMERITGKIGTREGTFVMQHGGIMRSGAAGSQFGDIIPGSGFGGFGGIGGTVKFRHGDDGAFVDFDLSFDSDMTSKSRVD